MAGTVYRLGKKGRLLADGTLLCPGRLHGDTLIKLRGQCFQLSESRRAVLRAAHSALAGVVMSRSGHVLVAHATRAAATADASLEGEAALATLLTRVRLSQNFAPAAISSPLCFHGGILFNHAIANNCV